MTACTAHPHPHTHTHAHTHHTHTHQRTNTCTRTTTWLQHHSTKEPVTHVRIMHRELCSVFFISWYKHSCAWTHAKKIKYCTTLLQNHTLYICNGSISYKITQFMHERAGESTQLHTLKSLTISQKTIAQFMYKTNYTITHINGVTLLQNYAIYV